MDLTKITNDGAAKLRESLKKDEEEESTEPEDTEETEATEEEEEIVSHETSETEEEETEEEEKEMTSRERALLREITRLKAKNREVEVKTELGEIEPTTQEKADDKVDVTTAEARLYTAWRNEALEDLIEKHPEYKTDPKLWERFTKEYTERVPELVWAKRSGVPVSKSLFRDRLSRIHRALQDDTGRAKEEGKKELLKAQSAASVMGAGAAKSSQPKTKKPAKKPFIPRNKGGLESWINKKN